MSPRSPTPRAVSYCRSGSGRTVLLMIVTVLIAGGCGNGPATSTASGPTTPAASSSPRPADSFSLSFYDHVADVSCPAGSPAGAMCFLLSGHGVTAGFGAVTVGPALDVEVPATSSLCAKPESFLEPLTLAKGEVTVQVSRPRLCIGATGPVNGTFVVIGGRGALAGAKGRGTVTIDVLASGAEETWTGRITVPATSS
jgi:hypothetical protein